MRKLSAIIGFVLILGIGVMTFVGPGIDLKYFLDKLGLVLVIGGSIAAIFISYSLTDVIRIASIAGRIFFREEKRMGALAVEIMQFAEQCSTSGIPTEVPKGKIHPFMNDCLALINDGYSDEEMRNILEQRILSIYDFEKHEITMVRNMTKYPPAFGMIGTVVGLIALMSTMGVGEVKMDKIGAYMAVALTTTLYGLMVANFIFKPIGDNLDIGAKINMKVRQITMEAAILIRNRASLLVIQDVVNSLLPPREMISYIGGSSMDGGKKRAA